MKSILPPPLQYDQPIVTFALSMEDQFSGLVFGVQRKYKDLVVTVVTSVLGYDAAYAYAEYGADEVLLARR